MSVPSLSDYSCALQREILLQGRLYLSENWICFYSNIFLWETTVRGGAGVAGRRRCGGVDRAPAALTSPCAHRFPSS